jgi:predicted nucleotidyltransferase
MRSVQDIQRTLAANKVQLFAKYDIKQMGIFGSYARNQQNEQSDIDILVDFQKPVGIEFIDLALELEKILQKKVDLVSRNGLKPKYLKSIADELSYV